MIDLAFVSRVLSIFNGFDGLSNEDIWWRTDEEYAPITFFVSCNDLFYWACSDSERITPENIELLEQTVKDVETLTKSQTFADQLFVCRQRQMRPQGACYDERYIGPKELWPLYDACGPSRQVGFGNPTERS